MSKAKKKAPLKPIQLIIITLAILVAVGLIFTLRLGPVDKSDKKEVVVEIPNGTGASAIVDILNDAGLVKSRTCAKIHVKLARYNTLQANTYIFNKSMSFKQMMTAINKGDFNYISKRTITIKDGERLDQVADAMAEEFKCSKEDVLKVWSDKNYLNKLIDKYWFLTEEILDSKVMYPLEGYLYADTYFVTTSTSSVKEFTEMCLDRMDSELSARKKAIKKSDFTIHQILTLTSIVTKESRAKDQPKVAGVFMNRLNKGMSLGSDVTVCYIYQEDRVELKQSQLDSDNPYNTRKFAGLPPGPICAVVGDAIDATLNYTNTDALFFFADNDGVVHFYKTEAEFEKGIEEIGLLKDDDSNTKSTKSTKKSKKN